MIRVIVGPPCAGKSTHVAENRVAGDVVVDFDKIAQALGSDVPHGAEGAVRSVAFACRSAAIEEILSGVGADAWIIHSRPSADLVQRYLAAAAEFTVLSPGLEVCLQRAEDDGRPDGTEQVIRDWYQSPPEIPGHEHEASLAFNRRTPLYARLTEIVQRA